MNEKDRRRYDEGKKAYDALMKFYPLTVDDLDGEVWKSAPYCSDYHLSNFGRVKSFYKGKVTILKPKLSIGGYLGVQLSKNGKKQKFYTHRLVAQAFIPNPDNKPEVNHQDGHKMNCFVGNLEWATQEENMQHAFNSGLVNLPQGSDRSDAKFTNEQVEYIRLNPAKLTLRQLAEKFGTGLMAISNIQLGKTYKNAGGSIRKAKKRSPNISEEMKHQIRADWATGQYSKAVLGRMFGVSHTTIIRILREANQ